MLRYHPEKRKLVSLKEYNAYLAKLKKQNADLDKQLRERLKRPKPAVVKPKTKKK